MTEQELNEIRKRHAACPIPEAAQADWKGTNHYEIADAYAKPSGSYWWLDGLDAAVPEGFESEQGRRLGAVLDYACAYRRDVGELLAHLQAEKAARERLQARLTELIEQQQALLEAAEAKGRGCAMRKTAQWCVQVADAIASRYDPFGPRSFGCVAAAEIAEHIRREFGLEEKP